MADARPAQGACKCPTCVQRSPERFAVGGGGAGGHDRALQEATNAVPAMSQAKTAPTTPPTTPIPSSSLLLVRDGALGLEEAGLEVLMIVRHHEIDFASGASVFPGGRVVESDSDPRLAALADGAEGLSEGEIAMRAAAVRECFEECGILLARRAGEAAPVGPDIASALAGERRALETNAKGLADILGPNGLRLPCDALVSFSHWITPEFMPKRFDTLFFIAEAPAGQEERHDGTEAVDSVWLDPARAIAEADAGQRAVVFATRLNLMRLAESGSVAGALDAARARPLVPVMPRLVDRGGARFVAIPADAGYGVSEAPIAVARGEPWPDPPPLPTRGR
jgi:8-oxo-dGTP pyrophosphatase MutT (NUDIX family)